MRHATIRILGAAIAIAAVGGGYSLVAGPGGPVPIPQQASNAELREAAAPAEPTGYRTVTLEVGNLTCATCPIIVKRALAAVDGVRAVEVSFGRKTAVVRYDPDRTGVAKLIAATGAVGFPATATKAVK